jgi:nicotinamide-nucleotide amidase
MPAIADLLNELSAQLLARKLKLVTAESCTGGLIAAACTDLAGSSQWFECGFVTYSNTAKERDLGVPGEILNSHGAVSEETVKAMVTGAARYGDLSIAVSGIAGPGGAVTGKPVGSVWIGCGNEEAQRVSLFQFDGDRDAVRQQSVAKALEMLLEFINGSAH